MAGGNWFVGVVLPATGWFPGRVGPPPDGVRLLHPDDLHLTVAFLGPCGAERAEAAWAALGALPLPLDATLAGATAFGSSRRPSALGVTLHGADDLAAAVAAARPALYEAAGAEPDERPVRLHGTFARVAGRASPAACARARTWAEGLALAGLPVHLDTVALFTRADPAGDPRGPRYRRVRERRLDGSP